MAGYTTRYNQELSPERWNGTFLVFGGIDYYIYVTSMDKPKIVRAKKLLLFSMGIVCFTVQTVSLVMTYPLQAGVI